MNKLKVKLNPALVKDLGDDKLLCLICNAQVKAKIWTAHSNGKKHHENIEALKKKRSVQVTAPLVTSKRRQSENDTLQQADSVISKRSRIETVTNATVSQKSEVPPWQRDQADGVEQSVAKPSSSKKIIEGVPEGFFDDEKLNSRVAETIEKQANMEVEYANFMSELDQAKRDEEVKGDEEDESSAIEKDIEQIDEQM
ncbi:hypothetical protein AB6A40_011098 [Gnathostoma spinigerum]|uniref:ZNF380 coiled-coil domain-containing protein n=1 Tax=Gnathostoma spinigerum TaxID=75299 RepID=A0ABD6EWP5_9BILA